MESANLGQKTILVIDDEAGIRTMLETKFFKTGYKVVSAANGMHALQKLKAESQVDLILCDMQMPGMSGLEFLDAVKKVDKYRFIPFIMFTGNADRPKVMQAIRSGIDDFILKPFRHDDLIAKIEAVFAKAQQPTGTD